jgi:hypothetical protein
MSVSRRYRTLSIASLIVLIAVLRGPRDVQASLSTTTNTNKYRYNEDVPRDVGDEKSERESRFVDEPQSGRENEYRYGSYGPTDDPRDDARRYNRWYRPADEDVFARDNFYYGGNYGYRDTSYYPGSSSSSGVNLYNERLPYWQTAYPPFGLGFSSWEYAPGVRQLPLVPVAKYQFRFIDNAPTDKGSAVIGEGSAFKLGSDAMLQCKFPSEYKIVSVSILLIFFFLIRKTYSAYLTTRT